MTMTLEEAVEQLRAAGLLACTGGNNIISGAAFATTPYYEKDIVHDSVEVNQFTILYYIHANVWIACIHVDHTCFPIKIDTELSNTVLAAQNFYTLCDHLNVDAWEVRRFIGRRHASLSMDIYDVQTLRVRLFIHPNDLTFEQIVASPHLAYKDDVFYIRRHEERWQLEYWVGPEIQFTMPLLHLEDALPTIARFFGRPTEIGEPLAQSDRPQSTDPPSSAD